MSGDTDLPHGLCFNCSMSADTVVNEGYCFKVADLLTNAEKDFYKVLIEAVSDLNVSIHCKVRLADLFVSEKLCRDDFVKAGLLHLDFVLCDKRFFRPLLVVELDDASHDRVDSQLKDDFKDWLLLQVNLFVVRVSVSAVYDVEILRYRLREYLGKVY